MRFIVTFIVAFFLSITVTFANEVKTLHFGVLSFRPKEITAAQWQPLASLLEQTLAPDYKIELLPMVYEDLDTAARNQQLDFILTNPEHYIIVKNMVAMNAIATLVAIDHGHPVAHFAGVIFTRADRKDIQTIEDLNDKVIAAPIEYSLGGYLMQRWELEKHGVHAKRYEFTEMPHDRVVDAVLAGKVDAGFIRSGVLESLAEAGKFTLDANSPLRVIAPHNLPLFNERIYSLHSTDHYPEWAFAIAKNVEPKVARAVTLKLLEIPADSEVAKNAKIAGFNPAADYTSVETLMLRMRSHPDELKYFSFEDVLWRYHESFVVGISLVLVILVLISFLIRSNRKVKKEIIERKKADKIIRDAYLYTRSLIEISLDPLVTINIDGKITDVNKATEQVTGIERKVLIGSDFANYFTDPELARSGYQQVFLTGSVIDYPLAIRHISGRITDVLYNASLYHNQDGEVAGIFAAARDITERKKAQAEIENLAFYDTLTNLPNRRKLLDHLQYMIALHHREGNSFAVLMMDLDKFKPVNDSFGHAAGDELLKQVAERIKHCLRECDFVARLGGDEFVVVVQNGNQNAVAHVANKIIFDLTEPFQLCYLNQCNRVQIGTSIGISFYPSHGITAEKLIDCADTALYLAKDQGRGCFAYYK